MKQSADKPRFIGADVSSGWIDMWQPPPEQLRRLDDLLRQRAMLVRRKTALVQSAGENRQLAATLEPLLAAYGQALKTLDRQIRQAAAEVPGGGAAMARTTSIPGIGLLGGVALLRLFMQLGHVNADVAIAFTGLDPRPMDPDNKRGSPELRRLLFNAAMSASRTGSCNPAYQRERDKGLPSTAALILLARKLVRVAYSLFKSGDYFNPALRST